MRGVAVIVLAAWACLAAAFSACGGDDDPGAAPDSGDGNEAGSTSSSGSSSSGGTGDGGTSTCAAYAEAICNRMARCTALLVDFGYGTIEACKEGNAIYCDRFTRAPGAAPLSAACIDSFAIGCGDLDPACAAKGSLTDGTPCEFDSQCTSGRCGSVGGTPGCGLCKAASDASTSRTPEGGSCDDEGSCERGLSCIDAGSSAGTPIYGTCEKTRALGEACKGAEDCNTGFYGDFGWMGFTVACVDGGCAKPLDEGAMCSGALNAWPCDLQKKLLCTSNTCSKFPFQKVNEACTVGNPILGGTCSGDLVCVGDAGLNGGTCIPKSGVGGACGKDFECRFGMQCMDSICTILPADHCK